MATLTSEAIVDLLKSTFPRIEKDKFNQFAYTLQRYPSVDYLMQEARKELTGSPEVKFLTMWRDSGSARMTGLLENDSVNQRDVMLEGKINWRHTTVNYLIVHQTDILMSQNSPDRIVATLKQKRQAAIAALVKLMENQIWSSPSSTSDKLTINGVPYWVVKNATAGFNGGAPTGHTTVGEIDPSTYTGFKNYTGTYGTLNKQDGIKKLRQMAKKIDFKPPRMANIPAYGAMKTNPFRIYMNFTTHDAYEEVLEGQNDNLGSDARPYGNEAVFSRAPIILTWQLDDDSDNPIYMLNHNSLRCHLLKGDVLRETVRDSPHNHNAAEVHQDLTWNICCDSRREQGVIYAA